MINSEKDFSEMKFDNLSDKQIEEIKENHRKTTELVERVINNSIPMHERIEDSVLIRRLHRDFDLGMIKIITECFKEEK